MATLVLTLNGANGRAHDWNHVLTPLNQIKTFLNTTLLDYSNIQDNGLRAVNLRAHAGVRLGRFKIRNNSGGTLTAGTIIYETGAYDDGSGVTYPSVAKAVSTQALGTTKYGLGVIEEDVANDADGTACTHYEITGLDTSAKTVGDRVYLSSTAGSYFKNWTDFADVDFRCQVVGFVTVSSATIGRILLCNWSIIPWQPLDPAGI